MDKITEKTCYRKKMAPIERKRSKRLWLALKQVGRTYINHTQVHGFFYLRANESSGCKRLFWWLVIIVSFSVGAVLLRYSIAKFFLSPFAITQGNPEMLMRIPFPSVSLCHSQTVIDYHSRQFIDKLKIPPGFDKADIIRMLPTALGIFTENQWKPIDTNNLIAVNEVLELNGISVLDAVKAAGIKCPDFILKCSFNKKRFPCFQDDEHFTFRETMSHNGVCCSFNYNPSNSSYDPMSSNSYGVRGGLSLIGTSFPHINDGTSGLLFSDGFILLMHPPHDFPTEDSSMSLLEVGKITSIGIYPTISTVSASVKALSIQSRKCLIERDVGLKIYRRPACTIKCLKIFVYDKCECHPYFLPAMDSDAQIRNCTVLDGECFQKYFYDMKKIRCKSCLPACEDIAYRMSMGTVSYNFANTSINPMYDQTNVTKTEFTAHIYFAASTVPVRRTIMMVSFIDLLASFGGVFNLVLGISIFSIMELVYYFCIKLAKSFRKSARIQQVMPLVIMQRPANNPAKKNMTDREVMDSECITTQSSQ